MLLRLARRLHKVRACKVSGGPSRNRTGVQGFAVLCVTTPPSGRERFRLCRERRAAVNPAATGFTEKSAAGHLSINGGWLPAKLQI
jgi:hypothetical protein